MNFFDWLRVVILGIIEGITEWIPVSSTGHLMILDRIWPGNSTVFTPGFTSMFNVVIQLGAILAVIIVFFHKLNPVSGYKTKEQKQATWTLWGKILFAVLPAAVLGFILDDFLDAHLYNVWVVSAMLILYGILFLVIESRQREKASTVLRHQDITWKTALFIGCFQVLALIPGTSRSGVTILGGLMLGLSRYIATEFTFFMAIPVMFGASVLKFVKYVFVDKFTPTVTQWIVLLVASMVAFTVSLFVIKGVLKYVKNHDFKGFGVYRILLGILLVFLFLLLL